MTTALSQEALAGLDAIDRGEQGQAITDLVLTRPAEEIYPEYLERRRARGLPEDEVLPHTLKMAWCAQTRDPHLAWVRWRGARPPEGPSRMTSLGRWLMARIPGQWAQVLAAARAQNESTVVRVAGLLARFAPDFFRAHASEFAVKADGARVEMCVLALELEGGQRLEEAAELARSLAKDTSNAFELVKAIGAIGESGRAVELAAELLQRSDPKDAEHGEARTAIVRWLVELLGDKAVPHLAHYREENHAGALATYRGMAASVGHAADPVIQAALLRPLNTSECGGIDRQMLVATALELLDGPARAASCQQLREKYARNKAMLRALDPAKAQVVPSPGEREAAAALARAVGEQVAREYLASRRRPVSSVAAEVAVDLWKYGERALKDRGAKLLPRDLGIQQTFIDAATRVFLDPDARAGLRAGEQPLLAEPAAVVRTVIERARSDRSSCRTCRKPIAKDELRFGEVALADPKYRGPIPYGWHHLECAAKRHPALLGKALARYKGEVPGRAGLEAAIAGKPDSTGGR